MWKAFFNRLKEPTSMAGIGVLAGMFGANPDTVQQVASAATALVIAGTAPNVGTVLSAVTALAGAAAFFIPEQKAPILIRTEVTK